jgi:hypothetical protein
LQPKHDVKLPMAFGLTLFTVDARVGRTGITVREGPTLMNVSSDRPEGRARPFDLRLVQENRRPLPR